MLEQSSIIRKLGSYVFTGVVTLQVCADLSSITDLRATYTKRQYRGENAEAVPFGIGIVLVLLDLTES